MPKKTKKEPTVTATPDPLLRNTNITITGEGFPALADLYLDFSHAPVTIKTDAKGGFEYLYLYPYSPGTACCYVKDMDEEELARVCWEVV